LSITLTSAGVYIGSESLYKLPQSLLTSTLDVMAYRPRSRGRMSRSRNRRRGARSFGVRRRGASRSGRGKRMLTKRRGFKRAVKMVVKSMAEKKVKFGLTTSYPSTGQKDNEVWSHSIISNNVLSGSLLPTMGTGPEERVGRSIQTPGYFNMRLSGMIQNQQKNNTARLYLVKWDSTQSNPIDNKPGGAVNPDVLFFKNITIKTPQGYPNRDRYPSIKYVGTISAKHYQANALQFTTAGQIPEELPFVKNIRVSIPKVIKTMATDGTGSPIVLPKENMSLVVVNGVQHAAPVPLFEEFNISTRLRFTDV